MRKLTKLPEPLELKEMKEYWKKKVAENGSEYYKTKYRARPIKEQLKRETSNKCIYCESKVGHNTPGDVEHKIPVSANEDGRFEWINLTIACTECNRRKNDFYNPDQRFLDPYVDGVETMLIHAGPVVFHKPGEATAEITVKTLELNETEKRAQLFGQKVNKLKAAMNLMDRIVSMNNPLLKTLLIKELRTMAEIGEEFSAMVKSLIEVTEGPWTMQTLTVPR